MESRKRKFTEVLLTGKGWGAQRVLAVILLVLAVSLVTQHIFSAAFGGIIGIVHSAWGLSTIMIIGFLVCPLGRKSWHDPLNKWFIIDAILISCAVANIVYTALYWERFTEARVGDITSIEMVLGTTTILALLILSQRVLGWLFFAICTAFLLQNITSPWLPGILYGPPIQWTTIIRTLWIESWGIYGAPMDVLSRYLILFLTFTAFITVIGASQLLMDIAASLAGRYAGGPAKIAVVASSLIGTVTSSSVANVVTTGTITIPMMKKMGFRPAVAGAVEASASSGGQIVPPVLGMTAFLIAQFVGITYGQVMIAVLGIALAYYASIFMMVHFEAKKSGLAGLPREQVPSIKVSLVRAWSIIVPIVLLFYMLMKGYSLQWSVLIAIGLIISLSMLNRATRLKPEGILMAFEEVAKMSVTVGVAVAACGIIIGTLNISGLGDIIGDAMVATARGNLLVLLVMGALLCLILGMGMPTPAVYISVFLVVIPPVISAGVPPLAAHMFAFFWAVFANITPPVAMASIAAATLAGEKSIWPTSWYALKFAGMAWILPFAFVYNPALLVIGPLPRILVSILSALVASYFFAATLQGYLLKRTNLPEQVMSGIAFVFLLNPLPLLGVWYLSSLIGVGLGAVTIGVQRVRLNTLAEAVG